MGGVPTAAGGGGGNCSISVLLPHCVTVTTVHSFHSFYQLESRQTLSIHEAYRAIYYQSNNIKRFMMHRNITASGVEMAAEKAARDRVGAVGSSPSIPPRRLGWPSKGFWGGCRGEMHPKMTATF